MTTREPQQRQGATAERGEDDASYYDPEPQREAAPLAVRPEPAPMTRPEPRQEAPIASKTAPAQPGQWQSAETDELYRALALAQNEFDEVKKTRTAKIRPGFEYQFANLSDVCNAIMPALRKHGLVPSQIPRPGYVITRLQHGPSGQWIAGALPLALPDHGSDIQRLGSAITYLRRYGLCMMTGVVAVDDDDDGAAAMPPRGRAA